MCKSNSFGGSRRVTLAALLTILSTPAAMAAAPAGAASCESLATLSLPHTTHHARPVRACRRIHPTATYLTHLRVIAKRR